MEAIDLTTLKTRAGEMIDRAKHEAVTISRYGKPAAVLISPETFEHYEKLEDEYWLKIALERRAEGGYLNHDESMAFINSHMTKTL